MKEVTALDRLESLNKAFSSENQFFAFYKKQLASKDIHVWETELKNIFKEIGTTLRNTMLEKDISPNAKIIYKKYNSIQLKVNAVQSLVQNKFESYFENQHHPSNLFLKEMENDMESYGYSFDEVSEANRKSIARSLNNLEQIIPFINSCKNVLDKETQYFYNEFLEFLTAAAPGEMRRKFKTEFTVPQLAYFFKVLSSKGIFNEDHKTEFFRAIADNIVTPNTKDGLSEKSIKNKFDSPEIAAMIYIEAIFRNCAEYAAKDVKSFPG